MSYNIRQCIKNAKDKIFINEKITISYGLFYLKIENLAVILIKALEKRQQ